MSELIVKVAMLPVPALVAKAGGRASVRFLEFFAATIRNPNARRNIEQDFATLMIEHHKSATETEQMHLLMGKMPT